MNSRAKLGRIVVDVHRGSAVANVRGLTEAVVAARRGARLASETNVRATDISTGQETGQRSGEVLSQLSLLTI